MAEVSTKGSKIEKGTANQHISIKKSNPPTAGWCEGYWENGVCMGTYHPPQPQPDSTDKISASIEGTVSEGSSNVYVGGKAVAFNGAKTTETDSYSLPSGWTYVSGKHTGVSGSVTKGSTKVFVNNKAIARKGDEVTTHASSKTTISEGSSTVYAN